MEVVTDSYTYMYLYCYSDSDRDSSSDEESSERSSHQLTREEEGFVPVDGKEGLFYKVW